MRALKLRRDIPEHIKLHEILRRGVTIDMVYYVPTECNHNTANDFDIEMKNSISLNSHRIKC